MGNSQTQDDKNSSYEHDFHPANVVAGISNSYTLKQVRDLLQYVATWTGWVNSAGIFANCQGYLGSAGETITHILEAVDKSISRTGDTVADVIAAARIGDAVKTLQRVSGDLRQGDNGLEAGRAWGEVVGGLSSFCNKTPALMVFGPMLDALSKNNVISNIQKDDDITSHYTDKGRQLRRALEQ